MRRRTIIGCALTGLLLGTLGGVGIFYLMTGLNSGEDAQFGPWTTLNEIGEAKQNPYTRARVAIYGIWGLPPSEVVYFTAMTDDGGAPLRSRCSYQVEGVEPPARWWSLTAYHDLFYIPNPANRYSWSRTTITPNANGGWTVRLSPSGQGENGLALGNGEGRIMLSYRLYQPRPGVAADRALVPLPRIRRAACGPG